MSCGASTSCHALSSYLGSAAGGGGAPGPGGGGGPAAPGSRPETRFFCLTGGPLHSDLVQHVGPLLSLPSAPSCDIQSLLVSMSQHPHVPSCAQSSQQVRLSPFSYITCALPPVP